MTTAYIYKDTGEIVGVRSGNHAGVVIDAEASGLQYLLSDEAADIDTHYVDVGAKELVQYPARPSNDYIFNHAAGAWQFNIDLGKNARWRAMKQARDTAEFGSFSYNSSTFDCDSVSQGRIQAAVQAALVDSSFVTTWTLSDNTTKELNAIEVKELGKALADHVKACHDRGRIVRAQIDAATTEAELAEINW